MNGNGNVEIDGNPIALHYPNGCWVHIAGFRIQDTIAESIFVFSHGMDLEENNGNCYAMYEMRYQYAGGVYSKIMVLAFERRILTISMGSIFSI